MDLLIKQKDKDIYYAVKKLILLSETTLTEVCEYNDLDYNNTYYALTKEYIHLHWLRSFVQMIDKSYDLKFNAQLEITENKETIYTRDYVN